MLLLSPTPDRSLQQRKDALSIANEIRMFRAQIKRDLKAQRVTLVELLNDPPEELETMKVCDLLLAAPKMGQVKVQKLLAICRISPAKTLGGMSDRQRGEIIVAMRAQGRHI